MTDQEARDWRAEAHTPDTAEVRAAWLDAHRVEAWGGRMDMEARPRERVAEFNRWLAAHDAGLLWGVIDMLDASPAVLWAGKGGIKEQLIAEADRIEKEQG